MICYVFPLADEAKDFLTHCTEREEFAIGRLQLVIATFRKRKVLVAFIGMGMQYAAESCEVLFSHFRLRVVILSGFGGALVSQLRIGNVVLSDNYSSTEILPFVKLLSGFHFGRFHTSAEVISSPEQREQLARSYNCQVVDMETSVVAKIAAQRRTPFVAIRAISDEFEQKLPAGALAAAFDPQQNVVTPIRLAGYMITHPQDFYPFQRFIRGLPIARKALTTFLIQITDEFPKHW